MIRYRFWRWVAPRLPRRSWRDWAWDRKWRLWFDIYGEHVSLWEQEDG